MLALVRHLCPCGTTYLVSLADEKDLLANPEWEAGAAAVADVIAERFVDGRDRGFFCPCCSRLHLRGPAQHVASPYGERDADEPLLSISLN